MKVAGSGGSSDGPLTWKPVLVGLGIAYAPSYVPRALRLVGIEFGPRGPPSVVLWNRVAVGILVVYIHRVEGRVSVRFV